MSWAVDAVTELTSAGRPPMISSRYLAYLILLRPRGAGCGSLHRASQDPLNREGPAAAGARASLRARRVVVPGGR